MQTAVGISLLALCFDQLFLASYCLAELFFFTTTISKYKCTCSLYAELRNDLDADILYSAFCILYFVFCILQNRTGGFLPAL
jgi:hypothetical protein